ncbi:hypothetical protein [Microlunatus antarcticus]|uniref:Capsular polysaccharide biosynthesis protein n=1 Tax=Microlunatus antarcticus TaxID=53388 RepID=A0A7W5JTQ3_9ACTN|nr:hypothetical protein [Microlunatus antarcticus]MBB3326098.1 hypothetical protein [Microlunatus antarcticus]
MPLLVLLRVCVRRWYVVLLGLALTLGGTYVAYDQPGVYYSEVQLVLVAPTVTYYPNTIASQPFTLAPMASLLVSDWNGTHKPLLTSSSDTTLYGEGVRSGTQVRLPNQGSQFRPLFTAPYVDIQVVGASQDEVTAEATRVVDELRRMLQRRQDFAGVAPGLRITTLLSPADVSASHVTGSSSRAAGVTFLLGLVVTALMASGADRLLGRTGRRRRPAPVPSGWPAT